MLEEMPSGSLHRRAKFWSCLTPLLRRGSRPGRNASTLAFSLAAAVVAGLGTAEAADGSSALRTAIAAAPFEERLLATGATTPAEDAALQEAITRYQAQREKDDLGVFDAFLRAYPHSGWRVALLANMGLLDYHCGYFSRALGAWHDAWEEGRGSTDPRVKILVDRVAGEELRMHARLGHADAIESLIAETGPRKLTGSATVDLDGAREGLWMMRNNPGVAYLCGPFALRNLLLATGRSQSQVAFLNDVKSGPQGVSLAEVAQLAEKAGLAYRLVFREVEQPVPVPSIIHWKVNHFAAIVAESGGRFHVEDPTFGRDLWASPAGLDAETSGYFLVPKTPESSRLRSLAGHEAESERGM